MCSLSVALLANLAAMAQDYIVVSHEANLFDEPSAKSYATTNQAGDDILVTPGMAFKKVDSRNGWDRIEYTPGLKAYINGSMEYAPARLSQPKPGDYVTANSAQKVSVSTDGQGNWKAVSDKGTYAGKAFGNVVVFNDQYQNQALSLVTAGGKTYLFDYNNGVTKFF